LGIPLEASTPQPQAEARAAWRGRLGRGCPEGETQAGEARRGPCLFDRPALVGGGSLYRHLRCTGQALKPATPVRSCPREELGQAAQGLAQGTTTALPTLPPPALLPRGTRAARRRRSASQPGASPRGCPSASAP